MFKKPNLMVFSTIVACLTATNNGFAENYVLNANNANWTNPAVWAITNGTIPGASDSVYVRKGQNVTISSDVGSITNFFIGETALSGTIHITTGGKLVTLYTGTTYRPCVGRPLADATAAGYLNLSGGTLQINTNGEEVLNVGVNTATAQGTGIFTISEGTFNGRLLVGSDIAGDSEDLVRIEGNGATIGTASTTGNALEVRASGSLEFIFGTNGISTLHYGVSGSGGKAVFSAGSKIIINGANYTGGAQTFTLIAAGTIANPVPAVTLTNFAAGTVYNWDTTNDIFTVTASGPSPASSIPADALMKIASTNDPSEYVFPSDSPYVLDPHAINPDDHAAAIQSAIDAIKNTSLSKGGIVFIKGGTYYLKRTLIICADGVTVVGLRDSAGSYPVFTYGDDFADADYNNRTNIQGGAITVLEYPAVIRINGNTNYSTVTSYRSHGLRGINIKYTGTSLGSAGGKATGVALHEVYHSPVQDVTITGSPNGPYNGIDTGPCMMPLIHNVTITGVRGVFGIRAGASDGSAGAQKYHGITITAPVDPDSTTDLIRFGGEGELIGANLQGGRIGIDMTGTSPLDDERVGNMTLRSVRIRDTARQGIRVNNAQSLGFTDVQIDYSGAEGLKVCDGLLGGLTILNLRINYAGYSAMRVQNGMNINIANAALLNSGQKKSSASSNDLPVAGLFIDKEVTSLSLAGARIGTSGGTSNEDWGVYWSTNTVSTNAPWHTPTIIASDINFFSNITTNKRTNNRGPLPALTIRNINGYNSLYNSGCFPQPGTPRPLMEDTWAIQKLPTDPEFADTWLKPAKGFNWFDLPEIRDRQWIDITSTNFSPRVVDAGGNISATAFSTLVGQVASAYSNGAVLFLPSGKFTNLNTTNPTFARKLYYIPAGGARLLINQPKIQFLGCGQDVTQIYVPHQTAEANLPPRDHVIKLASGSTGSGVFGMSVIYDNAAYLDTNAWADVGYGAAFRVQDTSQIRLVNLGADYGMGGCVSLVDSYDSELYQLWPRTAVNNSRPSAALAAYRIIGTTSNATHNIRLFQANAGSLANILVDGAFLSWNDANNYLSYAELPELDHVRIEGGADKIRIDYSTVIQGKNGLTVAEAYSLTPSNISACRFSTDHVQKALNLESMKNGDFLACWMNAAHMVGYVGTNCGGGNIRFSNMTFRGANLEGLSVRSGNNIDLVNCQAGRTCNVSTQFPQEDRPLTGIFIGGSVSGNVKMIGGMSGWLWYRLATATENGNGQDWGIILGTGFAITNYASYGTDLYGNGDLNSEHPASPYGYRRGLGLQLNSGTGAVWISDDSTYAMSPAADADSDGMPDYWELPCGTATGLAASVDNDGDRFSNLQEYIANTDPASADSCFKAAQNTRNTITWSPAPGRVCSVYWSTNLLQGFTNLNNNIAYPQSSYTNANPGSNVNFYQVRVRME